MAVFSLYVVNKAGGLIYHRDFVRDGLWENVSICC